jgi:DNA-binding Lrp family transcriptional regulator
MVSAVVLIKVGTGSVTEVANSLVGLKGVSEVFSVAGNYDVVALLRVAENEDLANLVSDEIRKIEGILSTETLIAFRTYSRAELEAGFALGIED